MLTNHCWHYLCVSDVFRAHAFRACLCVDTCGKGGVRASLLMHHAEDGRDSARLSERERNQTRAGGRARASERTHANVVDPPPLVPVSIFFKRPRASTKDSAESDVE